MAKGVMMVAHESVEVSKLPRCDFNEGHPPAAVDGKTNMGPWAYMCEGCFQSHGVGLGLGKGQRLIVKN